MVWLKFFNESASWRIQMLIFAAVWLGYSADRWFDSFRYEDPPLQRHRFTLNHRFPLLFAWILVLAGALILAVQTLESAQLKLGFGFMTLSIIFTILIQKQSFGSIQAIAKPLITAFLIAGSATLFTYPTIGGPLAIDLIPPTMAFLLFFINCILIRLWDKEIDLQQDPQEVKGLPIAMAALRVSIIILIFAAALSFFYRPRIHLENQIFIAVFLSLILLGLLHRLKIKIPLEQRRTYADLSLLTPLIFIW